MSVKWLDNGRVIRYSCNDCQKVLQNGPDEVLNPGIVVDWMIKNGKEKEVHFCDNKCWEHYFNGVPKGEQKCS